MWVGVQHSLATRVERGVHAASPHKRFVATKTKRTLHSVRTLKRRERRAPTTLHLHGEG